MIYYQVVFSYFLCEIVDVFRHQILSSFLVNFHSLILLNLQSVKPNSHKLPLLECILQFTQIIRKINNNRFDSKLQLTPIWYLLLCSLLRQVLNDDSILFRWYYFLLQEKHLILYSGAHDQAQRQYQHWDYEMDEIWNRTCFMSGLIVVYDRYRQEVHAVLLTVHISE